VEEVVIYPVGAKDIVVAVYSPDVIGNCPRPHFLETLDMILAPHELFPEQAGEAEMLRHEIPGLRMNVAANIVSFGIDSCLDKFIRVTAFPVRIDLEEKLLRIVQRHAIGFRERIILSAEGVHSADKIER